ncbi:FAD-dependent monooxygenase [Actinorugispora endophytica]|uniref:4,5-epoxidase n=1 Tax=Actinorugispora endophytica TaxID=1605990 RepID=A0A4R6UC84_9ACTN|nr:FAD-dependent monooxygenase [Actinorugispora endophytica]TDQ44251.1 4,5-epoxidase [Actinorugispora endophytica]
MEPTDVLVVGAGPAGLTLACGLLLQGASVRVVDRAPGPATSSRANFLHARGSEVLGRLGALGDLPERSIPAMTITLHAGGRTVSTIRFGDAGLRTSRPAMLTPQSRVEAALRARLAELGGRVEWDTPLVDASQDDNGITATLGGGRTARAGWLAGCDGAHSTTRGLAGMGFPGVPIADRWLLADVRMDWAMSPSGSHGWLHRDGLVGALPMRDPDGAGVVWRLMAYLPGSTDDALEPEQVLERMRRILPERTGLSGVEIHDAVWTSTFRIHRRLAEDYRRGRFLLVGDAAHIHSPMGGQGMLTGIGDAENLAWKLSLVARGRAAEALLDTYTAERRPLAAEVLRTTSANTRFQVGEGAVVRFLREHVMPTVMNLPPVQRWATSAASQLGVSYRRGPLGTRPVPLPGRAPRPGDRVPDLACLDGDGGATRLHAELGARWVVLTAAPDTRAWTDARKRLGGRVTALRPERAALRDALLVRPDGHLAWRGHPGSADLGRWLDDALERGRAR